MKDIHTHILPNIDDGSRSLELSRDMLLEEVKNGVDEVFLTPHICIKTKQYFEIEELKRRFDEFAEFVKDIPIKLHLGSEIFYREGTVQYIQQKKLLPLGNSDYYLIEFPMYQDSEDLEQAVSNLLYLGYKVVLAHPERYDYCNVDMLIRLQEDGCLFQVNSSSILGDFGREEKRRIKMMAKNNLIDFVASDCHNMHIRKPNLRLALNKLKKRYNLVITNDFKWQF